MFVRPSNFVSNNYHHPEASFQSQDEMLALPLLQGRMSSEELLCLEQWGNGAAAGLSECHSRRPSSQVQQNMTKDDLNPGPGRRATWAQ